MKVGFVFTNFNNSHFTREAVHSLSLNNFDCESVIVIVDNKSDESEIKILEEIKADFPFIYLIFNNENLGYFSGLNIGISFLRDNHKNIDHIIVGNNDLIFPHDFLKSIFENDSVCNKYAVISPDIITLDGVHQNPQVISKISKFRDFIYDLYYTSYLLSLLIKFIARVTSKFTYRKDVEQFEIAQTIHQGYGACYILSPLFFKYFDQLWTPPFLMGEELYLRMQLESKNLKTYYNPNLKVQHQHHAAVNNVPKKKIWELLKEAHKTNREYERNKH